jgi:ABC-2 type transport system permease protein
MIPPATLAPVRRTLLYSWLSYRALFDWASPRIYIATLVVLPASVGSLFAIISSEAHADPTRPVLGSALLATNNAVLYGVSLVVMNERWQGTMELWLAAPQGLLRSVLAKSLVHMGNGVVTAALTLTCVALVFQVGLAASDIGPLLLCVLAVTVSATGIGLVTASFGIWARNALAAPNAMRSVILLTSGAVVDTAVVAGWLDRLGVVLPVRNAVEAGHRVLLGQELDGWLLVREVLVGCAWGLVGYLALRYVLVLARRQGRLSLR